MSFPITRANGGGRESLNTVADAGSAYEIDLTDGNVHDLTLTQTCAITIVGTAASVACEFTLILRQDATGSRTVTWPASLDWDAGTAPTLTTTANGVDVLRLLTVDNGTTWLGFVRGQAMA